MVLKRRLLAAAFAQHGVPLQELLAEHAGCGAAAASAAAATASRDAAAGRTAWWRVEEFTLFLDLQLPGAINREELELLLDNVGSPHDGSIDLAVLYPTMLLGLQSMRDVDFAEAQARAYNDWCSDHVQQGEGRLFGAGALPAMHSAEDVERVAAEIRRVADLPGMVSVFMRPNPSVDWRPFNDPVYDPIWRAASETGLPIGLHPFLAPDLPGACVGLQLDRPRLADGRYVDDWESVVSWSGRRPGQEGAASSVLFTQAIANPVDVMSCIAYLTAGGVLQPPFASRKIILSPGKRWSTPPAVR